MKNNPNTKPGPYYVSAIDGPKTALVSGPYPTHAEALALVDTARVIAERHDPRTAWAAFGTMRIKDPSYAKPGVLQRWGYSLDLSTQNPAGDFC